MFVRERAMLIAINYDGQRLNNIHDWCFACFFFLFISEININIYSLFQESKSWWMPSSMSTFTSGLQILRCQIQVLSRMLFGIILIGAITFLLIQRSSTTHQTMPITFILLLLGVVCGYAGKFCIDTLGGRGNHWLIYWEAICLLHFFSNMFHSTLFVALNGPVTAVERLKERTMFPYWARRVIFYSLLLSLPLLCGLMPFASFWEWIDHFSSLVVDFNDDFHQWFAQLSRS